MKAGLYVVATPIGHLDDLSQRALHTLQQVQLIAAEDTRQSAHLLQHHGIHTPLTACHDHNEGQRAAELIGRIQQGEAIALISDAGTPLISDPGFRLVRAAHDAGVPVSPIPGPCAAIAALSAAGLPSDRFFFEGFLPAKTAGRQARLHELATEPATLIFYEAPHRIAAMLEDLCHCFGPDRQATLCRELTKTFETLRRAPLATLRDWVASDPNQQKGEIVLVVAGADLHTRQQAQQQQALEMLKKLLPHMPLKTAAQLVADWTGLKKNDLYQQGLDFRAALE